MQTPALASGDLHRRDCWIFDMDGTLTLAVHDFPAIARALGLPDDEPILESLSALPPQRRLALYRRLDEIELELAEQARVAAGAEDLLRDLAGRGHRLAILTRNARSVALRTLAVCGLSEFFPPERILGREQAEPKPAPDGIHRLLELCSAAPGSSVMVGDFLFDLQAGRAAGVATVYVDGSGRFPWRAHADVSVTSLEHLCPGNAPI